MSEFSYEHLNDKSIVLRIKDGGLTHPCHSLLKKFQARWNPRIKSGSGWVIPKSYEKAIIKFIESYQDQVIFNSMEKGVKNSRKTQHKYHRAISENEDDAQDIKESIIAEEKERKETIEEKEIVIEEKKKTEKPSNNIVNYFKSFRADPGINSEDEDDSDDYESNNETVPTTKPVYHRNDTPKRKEPRDRNYREPRDRDYREPRDRDYREPRDRDYREPRDRDYREPRDRDYREPRDESSRQRYRRRD
jgi:hypothetical protein